MLSLSLEQLDFIFNVLAKLGYKVGGNLIVDYKFAQGRVERLPALAAELVAAKPDLLLGPTNVDVAGLKHATSTIPIVMMFAWGPVETGKLSITTSSACSRRPAFEERKSCPSVVSLQSS